MRRRLFLLFAGLAMLRSVGIYSALAQERRADVDGATGAATAWLALVDAGKYDDAWSASSTLMRRAVPQTQLVRSFSAVRAPLGSVMSRKLKDARYAESAPGAPDGHYVILHYLTSFENKKAGIETITTTLDQDGAWRVSGYYIK